MKSKLFSLNLTDALKGFIMAVIGALLGAVYAAIQQGGLTFTWAFWQPILYTALAAGISYLIKNFLTNSSNQPFTKEVK